jgi:hypothetical protein
MKLYVHKHLQVSMYICVYMHKFISSLQQPYKADGNDPTSQVQTLRLHDIK